MKCLLKISGDLSNEATVLDLLWRLEKIYHYCLTVIPGAGTKTTEALIKAGLPIGDYQPFPKGRILQEPKSRWIQIKEATLSGKTLQGLLSSKGIDAEILICAKKVDETWEAVNGDELVIEQLPNYDLALVLTVDGRKEQKTKDFVPYNANDKIKIIGVPSDLQNF